MADKKRKAMAAMQQTLEMDFSTAIVRLSESVEQSLQANQQKINQLQDNKVQKLLNLIQERSRIESEIIATTAELSDQYDRNMKLLTTVLRDRMDECGSTLDDLKTIAREQEWQEGVEKEHA